VQHPLHHINITCEPLPNNPYAVPFDAGVDMEALGALIRVYPSKAVAQIQALLQQYPQAAVLYNYLSAAYKEQGRYEEAFKAIQKSYLHYPEYLFAKTEYASYCLEQGDLKTVAQIFDNQFEINALYPEREEFHIVEVMNFYGIIGAYYAAIGELGMAEYCLSYLKDLAPYHNIVLNLEEAICKRQQMSKKYLQYWKTQVPLLLLGALTTLGVCLIVISNLLR